MQRIASAAIAAALALALAAPAARAQPGDPQVAAITIKNFDFSAMTATIGVGGSVTWKNLDGEPHTVVGLGGAFRSPALDQGESFTFRFVKAGTYSYICSIHPQMKATIVVR